MKVGVKCWAPPEKKCDVVRGEMKREKNAKGGIVSDLLVNYEAKHDMTILHATLILSGKVLRYILTKACKNKTVFFMCAAGFKLVYLLLAKY